MPVISEPRRRLGRMLARLSAAVVVAVLSASPSWAQEKVLPLELGAVVSGRVQPTDQRLADGWYRDSYSLAVTAGQVIRFSLYASDINIWGVVSRQKEGGEVGKEYSNYLAQQDYPTVGDVLVTESGIIRFTIQNYKKAKTPEGYGYTFSVSSVPAVEHKRAGAAPAVVPQATITEAALRSGNTAQPIAQPSIAVAAAKPTSSLPTIKVGSVLSGRLQPGDATRGPIAYRDAYRFDVEAGQVVRFALYPESTAINWNLLRLKQGSDEGILMDNFSATAAAPWAIDKQFKEAGAYKIILESDRKPEALAPQGVGYTLSMTAVPAVEFKSVRTAPKPIPAATVAEADLKTQLAAASTPAPQPTSVAAVARPVVEPPAINWQAPAACENFVGEAAGRTCHAALTAALEADPKNWLARLLRADTSDILNEVEKSGADLRALRAQLGPDAFETALTKAGEFVSAGAADCRFYVSGKTEWSWSGPCANGVAQGDGMLLDTKFRTVNAFAIRFDGGVIAQQGARYTAQLNRQGGLRWVTLLPGDRERDVSEGQVPEAARSALLAAAAGFPAQTTVFENKGVGKAGDQTFANGNIFHCYTVYAMPGERWQITLKTPGRTPWIGVQTHREGDWCWQEGWQTTPNAAGSLGVTGRADTQTAQYEFNAAGGVYYIAVSALGGLVGEYTLERRKLAGKAANTLPPGAPVPFTPAGGAASTVAYPLKGDYAPGQQIKDCPTCPAMVVVPPGSFMMGSPGSEEGRRGDEGPRRMVTFKRPFAIGKFEVTFEEWDACVADGGCVSKASDQGWGRGRQPAINLSASDMRRYVGWLTHKTGFLYFLPSEAEWEYAARAGSDTPWNTGDGIITDDGNFLKAFDRPVPVGGFPPNAFGLHDVHGNVRERVQDCHDIGYFGAPTDGSPKLTPSGCKIVVRGGNYASEPAAVRSAARFGAVAGAFEDVGFRVARALD